MMTMKSSDRRRKARSGGAQRASRRDPLLEANEHLVIAAVRAQSVAEAAEQTAAQMTYLAEHDFLTRLPNRALLTDRLSQAMALAQRNGKRVALMYLDLDHFKHINDSLGHAIGDQLLQSAARRLQACVRLTDTVSRQGGDEFVVLLSAVEAEQDAALTAEKMIKSMAEPHLIAGHSLHVALSIGISLYPDDGKDLDSVVRNADTAMYQAKRNGRNNYQRFTPDMNARALARHSIEAELRRALDSHEFELQYQPKVNLDSGAITGAEALLRWRRSDHRTIATRDLVAAAAECGLMRPIGHWVLGAACRQAVEWLRAGLDLGQMAVNVAAVELDDRAFSAGVGAILHDTGLDPNRLELELTECDLMRDTEATAAVLYELKDLGVRLAFDNFGTGYSSLTNLQRLPIDTLKINPSFVLGIGGAADESVIDAIIALGHSLQRRIVAESVETRQQFEFLQGHRCSEGQGNYFCSPVGYEDFARVLRNR